MATTYTKDDGPIGKVVQKAIKNWHTPLAQAQVTVEVLLAGNPDGPAVTAHGWPAAAVASVNNLKNRAAGLEDVRIVVDSEHWEDLSDEEKLALIDHELQHFEVAMTKHGFVKKDDLNRPKIKLRKHDWEVGGFDVISERHQAHAPEVQVAAKIKRRLEQLEIDWTAAELAGSTGTGATGAAA